jgi:hypothetical protein
LRAALLASRNDDGGWGYRRGKQSRIEPTSFALIALAASEGKPDASVLTRWPQASGLLIDPSATHANIAFNAIAALAAQYPPLGIAASAGGFIKGLLSQKGVTLPPSTTIAQDNALIGWPWVEGTFSWLEPTAWSLLALKRWVKAHPSLDAAGRIDQAERLIRDRACPTGGWNYGNPQVLDKPLEPYAATTALALIALQNRSKEPVVTRALDVVERLTSSDRSGFALALTRICLGLFARSATDVDRAIEEASADVAERGDNLAIALLLYAIDGRADVYEAFRV